MTPAQELLGALILNPALLDAADLVADDFPHGLERECFAAIARIHEDIRDGHSIDLALLKSALGGNGSGTFVSGLVDGNVGGTPQSFRARVLAYRQKVIEDRIEDRVKLRLKDRPLDVEGIRADLARLDELEGSAAGKAPGPVFKTGAELQAVEIQVEWTIDKLQPARSLTLLHSRSGLGKTWLGLGAAKAVSLGEPFLGLETKARPVYYVDFENPLPLLIERVRKLDVRDVNFWHLSAGTPPPKLDSADWTLYMKLLPPGSLVIFDTLRAAHDGDENSSQDAAIVMGRLKQLRETGLDIFAFHHTGKASDRVYKGSTAWADLADHVIDFHQHRRHDLAEADDEDLAPQDALFSLGTGAKTRFAPFRIYLQFDPATGTFTPAEGPDSTDINEIAGYIASAGHGQNQTELWEWAKDAGVGPKRKESFKRLLERGERLGRWTSHRGLRGARIYDLSS